MTVDAKLMTAEELAAMPDDGNRYELVNGELIAMAPSFGRHGVIAGRIAAALGHHVRTHRLGELIIADAGYILRRAPDTVRAPDAAFIRKGRTFENSFIDGAPDLVVEVISSSDRYTEVNAKVREYLRGGAQMIIVVDPRTETVTVHTPSGAKTLSIDDTLDGGDVVPGWRLALRELFEP